MKSPDLTHLALILAIVFQGAAGLQAHTNSTSGSGTPTWFKATSADTATLGASVDALNDNGVTLLASFARFAPKVRVYWDATTFYVESEGMPMRSLMPEPMVGITSWQQQIPLPTSYFTSTTNPETDSASIGFGKTND